MKKWGGRPRPRRTPWSGCQLKRLLPLAVAFLLLSNPIHAQNRREAILRLRDDVSTAMAHVSVENAVKKTATGALLKVASLEKQVTALEKEVLDLKARITTLLPTPAHHRTDDLWPELGATERLPAHF